MQLDQYQRQTPKKTQTHVTNQGLNLSFFSLFSRCDCPESGHLIDVTHWWLFVVVEFPGETRPPPGMEPIPEVLAVPLLGRFVFLEVTFEVRLPQTRVITLRTTALGVICAQSGR